MESQHYVKKRSFKLIHPLIRDGTFKLQVFFQSL